MHISTCTRSTYELGLTLVIQKLQISHNISRSIYEGSKGIVKIREGY